MNPSTKTLAILSLSASIGKILSETKSDDRIIWRGKCLFEAGFEATKAYPFPALTNSKIKQIKAKIDEVCAHGHDINMIETLSFLICGLVDLRANINKSNWVYLDPVLIRAQWVMDLFDGKNDDSIHQAAYNRYEAWVN